MSFKKTMISATASLDVQRLAAGFCVLLSVTGAGLGVHLTRVKFQMTYTPCLSAYGGCRVGGLTCDDALGSSMSTLLELPISLWGTGFYLATGVAAAMVMRRDAFDGTAVHLLLGMAGFAVFVSLVLGGYTAVALESACPYCISLYTVSVLLLGGAALAWRTPGKDVLPLREVLQSRLAGALDGLFLLALVLVAATGVQSMLYHGSRSFVSDQDGCVETVASLPTPSIREGAEDPQVILALFVDLTCPKCRIEFKELGLAVRDGKFPAPVQLWIFHTPRHACDPAAFPSGYAKTDDGARFDQACLAARAAECMEKLQAGAGFELMGGLFALHDDREPGVPLFTAERIGSRAVECGMEIDPDDEHNKLIQCIDNDLEVLARITEHQRYAEDPKFSTPTLLVYPARAGAPDLTRKPLVGNANTSLATVIEYVAMQAGAGAQGGEE